MESSLRMTPPFCTRAAATSAPARSSASRRLSAWVFNLSREWRPEWGGLLLFHEGARVVDGFNPVFNSLSLFKVPMDHSVTQVVDFAPRDRLAISGWYLKAE